MVFAFLFRVRLPYQDSCDHPLYLLESSHRTFTYGNGGWIWLRIPYQRSVLPTMLLIVLHRFFILTAFKEFSFWSKQMGLEPNPSGASRQHASRLHHAPNSCLTKLGLYGSILFGFVHEAHSKWLYTHYSISTNIKRTTSLRSSPLFGPSLPG